LVRTQVDFREYKENTIQRRINRRMVALGIDDYDEYVDFCRTSEAEVEALHRDLLISVTRFFRDPEQFEQLNEVIKTIVEERDDRQIRVWVAGCATGEEAYSIAILLAEALGGPEKLKKANVQIFASDIDERALEVGRRGLYLASAAADIPPHLFDRYFERSGGNIQVIPAIRNLVLFSRHNVAQDPPFINVDLVSLRNILIYFNSGLQERVLRRVHYALNHSGSLFLGTSEAIGMMQAYFKPRTGTDKVFAKRTSKKTPNLHFGSPSGGYTLSNETRKDSKERLIKDDNLFDALARSVAPNGFIVTKSDQIVRIIGDISNVVHLSENSALNMSTRILRPGLRDEASSLISVTLKMKEARSGRWHPMDDPQKGSVRLRAFPIISEYGEDNVLFGLEHRDEPDDQPQLDQLSDEERVRYVRQIEQEMNSTREALQQTVEELQTSNEELQSVNEELQSTNEELQATNEELETSNEELQSTNEELITVNEEMQVNSSELQRLTVELASIVQYAPYPILVVDHALVVRRISDRAKEFFDLDDLPSNGLHVAQIPLPDGLTGLASLCNDAFRERSTKTQIIEAGGTVYQLLVTPFTGQQHTVLGLKITVFEQEVASFFAMAEAMDELGGVGHWRISTHNGQLYWSKEVYRMHGRDPQGPPPTVEEAINYYHEDDRERVQTLVDRAMSHQEAFAFEARLVAEDGTIIPVRSGGKVVKGKDGQSIAIVGAFQDCSQDISNQILLRQFQEVQNDLGVGFYSYDVANNRPFWSLGLYEILGLDPATQKPSMESAVEIFHPDDRDMINTLVDKAIKTGENYRYKARLLNAKGDELPCEGFGETLRRDDGTVSHVYGFFRLLNETLTDRA
jgi:chemotaxis protein methyltransferase CheR/two-component system CheB/CheR fusion protein